MKNNLSKIFCIFIFTCISLHIFVLNLNVLNINYSGDNNLFYNFYFNLWLSIKNFDISWIILGIFIYDFYYHSYFVDGVWKVNKILIISVSIILSIITLVLISIYYYHDLQILYYSYIQIYKCSLVGIGYYFIIFSILKRIFFIKEVTNKQGDKDEF